jgi:Tfp pilus assembly protein PilF
MRGTTGKDMIRCGDLWEQAKERDKANAAWSRALDFRGSESEANAKLAEYAKAEGNLGKARELYKRMN